MSAALREGYARVGSSAASPVNTALRESEPVRGDSTLLVARLGRADYDQTHRLQEELREHRLGAAMPDVLLLLEHPPVYTLGRNADGKYLGAAANGPIPVRRVSRGGQVTYHGPGQLVGYAIVDLRGRGLDVGRYVRSLEEVVIRTAAACGVHGTRVAGQPGVWVGNRKLASVGIGLRRWVSVHGFAMNVTTDLSHFDAIVPCGLSGVRMTSLAAEGAHVALDWAIETTERCFADVLGHRTIRRIDTTAGDWPSRLAAGTEGAP